MQHQRKPRLLSTGASSSAHQKVVTRLRDHSPRRSHCIPKHKSPHRLSKKCWCLSKKRLRQSQLHRETVGLMLTNFRVGDRVEDKETHKRGRVTFVYSELELKGEFIAVLFDGHDDALAVPTDSVRKVSKRQ
jgi:hypothetical protein